jgi:hypothetical protein
MGGGFFERHGAALAKFTGLGAGSLVALALVNMISSQPQLAMGLLDKWGAPFALTVFIVAVFNQRVGQMVETGNKNANALTSMAGAIDRIATKDSQREMEMEILVGRLNGRYDEIRGAQDETREQLKRVLAHLEKKGAPA